MSLRQKVLRMVYPAWMWWAKLTGRNVKTVDNTTHKHPVTSFYDLKAITNDGTELNFADLKGKKVMLVNTASNCGYTNQYADLQKLYEDFKGKLMIIGFPANDFKEQEKGSDEEIATFCQRNYNVTFPMAKKSSVVKSPEQNAVFQWLTDASKNGWCNQSPTWNFSKYLVNENGTLTDYFGASVSPTDEVVLKAIKTD